MLLLEFQMRDAIKTLLESEENNEDHIVDEITSTVVIHSYTKDCKLIFIVYDH